MSRINWWRVLGPAICLATACFMGWLIWTAGSIALGEDSPQTITLVPQQKLVKAVKARDAARSQVKALRRTLKHEGSVDEALTIASVVYGVPRSELASVSWCESRHVATARNGRYRGLFQQGPMFESTPFGRAGLSVWSPYAAALSAAYVVKQQGWRQWQCQPGGGLAW